MGEFRLGSEIICSKGKEPVAWSCFGSILGEFEVILSCIGIGSILAAAFCAILLLYLDE